MRLRIASASTLASSRRNHFNAVDASITNTSEAAPFVDQIAQRFALDLGRMLGLIFRHTVADRADSRYGELRIDLSHRPNLCGRFTVAQDRNRLSSHNAFDNLRKVGLGLRKTDSLSHVTSLAYLTSYAEEYRNRGGGASVIMKR